MPAGRPESGGPEPWVATLLAGLPFLLLAILLAVFGLRRIAALDIWWHLAAGRWIAEHGEVPRADVFSHTAAGQPWYDVHWLFQVLAYHAVRLLGLDSLIVGKTLLFLAAFGVSFIAVRREHRGAMLAVLLYFGILISQVHFLERPTAFTALFTALYAWVLEAHRRSDSRCLWLLPAIHLVWANLHGVAAVGIVMAMVYAVSDLVCAWTPWSRHESTGRMRRGLRYLAVAALCLAASTINPFGFKEIAYAWGQFRWVASDAHPVAQLLDELWPAFHPDLAVHGRSTFSQTAFVGLTALSFLLNARRVALSHLLITGAFLYLFLTAMRNSVLFALVAVPIAAENFGSWIEARQESASRRSPGWTGHAVQCLLAAVLVLRIAEVATDRYYRLDRGDYETGWGVQHGLFPEGTAGFLEREELEGNLYNDADFGGYLIWRLYPRVRVFVDGRHEVYGRVAEENALARGRPDAFLNMIGKYGVSHALIRHTDPAHDALIDRLASSPDWSLASYDEVSALFIRRDGRNAALLERLGDRLPAIEETLSGQVVGPVAGKVSASPVAGWLLERSSRRVSRFLETLGAAYEEAGKEAQALEAYRRAAVTGQASSGVYYYLGSQALRRGALEEALSFLTQAIDRAPEHAPAHANLAVAWELKGDMEKAFAACAKAVEVNPDLVPALNQLGRFWAMRGHVEEARRLWRHSLELQPRQERVKDWLERSENFSSPEE